MPMRFDELLIVIVVAMVVIGPKRLPEYAAKLARGIRQLRVMADGAKAQLKEQMGPEFEEVDWRQYDPRQYDPRKIVREALREPLQSAWGPVGEELEAVRGSARSIGAAPEREAASPAALVPDLPRTTPWDIDAT